jgi:quercetin dioxygenase-like cupin family protein
MTDIAFKTFETEALAQGFDEVAQRQWPAGQVVDEHTHPFSVKAQVVQGEMWLTVGAQTRHLQPGDTFELAHGAPHAERYGPAGATYWAARRGTRTAA